MINQKDRLEAAIRHIKTSADIDPWAMELAVDALKAQIDKDIDVPNTTDCISRQQAIDEAKVLYDMGDCYCDRAAMIGMLYSLPSAQPEEVIPHRNYKYLSDYWCECGWHLGKRGEVKYCANCGRKVNWDG